MSPPSSKDTVSGSQTDMIQMDFDTVTQTKHSITLNHFSEYVPDDVSCNLYPATQMYLNHLILYFLSFVVIRNHQISTRQVIV
jgi:hypothetical protein